jgi:hypothetical protein
MKNLLFFALVFLVISCSENSEENTEKSKSPTDVSLTETDTLAESNPKLENTLVEEEEKVEPFSSDECLIDFLAYVFDPSETPTNVRKSPGGKVLMTMKTDLEHVVHIIDIDGKWMKIDHIEPVGYDEGIPLDSYDIPGKTAWVHQSVLQIGTRNYGDQALDFYVAPDVESEVLFTLNEVYYGNPVAACGDFIQLELVIDGKKMKGWINKEWLCANPLTTCS